MAKSIDRNALLGANKRGTLRRAIAFDPASIEKQVTDVTKTVFKSQTRSVYGVLTQGRGTIDQLRSSVQSLVSAGAGEAKTLVDTGLSVIGRERIADAAEGLGLTNYLYSGGEIATTREFCTERDGQYFTQAEVEAWASEEWDGQLPGTNEETIFSYCGGWNCRHELIPVPASAVPKDREAYNAEAAARAEKQQQALERSAETGESTATQLPPSALPVVELIDESLVIAEAQAIVAAEEELVPRGYEKATPALRTYEKSIQAQNYESAAFIDKDGNTILSKDGSAHQVQFSNEEIKKLKGAILTHNHPGSNAFSSADWSTSIAHKAKSIRAQGKDGSLYSLDISPTQAIDPRVLDAQMKAAVTKARKEIASVEQQLTYKDGNTLTKIMYLRANDILAGMYSKDVVFKFKLGRDYHQFAYDEFKRLILKP